MIEDLTVWEFRPLDKSLALYLNGELECAVAFEDLDVTATNASLAYLQGEDYVVSRCVIEWGIPLFKFLTQIFEYMSNQYDA